MPRLWVYSIGSVPDRIPQSSNSAFAEELSILFSANLGRIERPSSGEWSVAIWDPFRSEREHHDEVQVILLFVGTGREMTRHEYFVACNALSLRTTKSACLVTIVIQHPTSLPPTITVDPWAKHCRAIFSTLCHGAFVLPLDDVAFRSWLDKLLSHIAAETSTDVGAQQREAGPVTLFLSYSHHDEDLRDELAKHLCLLEQTGLIRAWHDRHLRPGDDWATEISVHLYTADLILLLLSADFFASAYCSEVEVPVALKRHELEAARAIPVVLRPVLWRVSPLARLQALPTDALAVTEWKSHDLAFLNVCEGILRDVLIWTAGGRRTKKAARAERDVQRWSQRRRVLDAAMPAEIEVDTGAMMVVLVRLPSSSGLRGLVAVGTIYGIRESGITEEVVQSKPVELRFPINASNKPEPLTLRLEIQAPDFQLVEPKRNLVVPPAGDSQPYILLVSAKKPGDLTLVVEVYEKDTLIAACPLRTHATESPAAVRNAPTISSVGFDIRDDVGHPETEDGPAPAEERHEDVSQRRAASLIREARELMTSGDLSRAQEKICDVLELDPTNREARRVHDSLQKDQRRRQVRTKVDTLLQEGEAQLGQRQFNQAIQSFESAWRLDTSDTHINDLLGQAKAALEANRQASRLLSEARREMLAGNLDAAYENAAGALKADTQHHDAEALCENLRQQIEERGRRLRVESGIHRVEEHLARKDLVGARAVLGEIAPEADPGVVRDLRSRIEAEETELMRGAREQRVQQGVAKARQQMQANQLAEAGETLRALLDEFPDATLATKLLAAIGEHIEAQRRAEAISALAQQALSLLQSKNFLDARRVLESGLQAYPSDAALQRLLGRALDLQRGHERTLAAGKILEQARELRAIGKIEAALALVGQALVDLGPDVGLTDLKRQLEFDREQQQYDAGLREALAQGQALVDAGKFADAVAALEASAALYPGEPELTSLLASAQHAQAEQEEHQSVAEVVARVAALGSRQQWQDALEGAEEALKRYPYNATLTELTARTRENWRQQQRQYNVARRRGIIEQALASGNLIRAANELQTARQDFPGEQGFDELDERLRQAQVQAQLDSLEQQVRQNLSRGHLDSASQQLTAAQGLANHPRWKALKQELARRQQYQQSLQKARQLNELKDYRAAEELLEQLVRDNPPDKEAAALLRMIRADRRRVEVERACRQALEDAERLFAAGEYHKAQQILQEAIREAPDRRAEELLKMVTAERGQAERQQRLEQGKKEIRALLGRGAFQKALTEIDELLGDFSADLELGQFRASAEQQRDLSEALAKIKDLEQRRQFETALDVAESILQTSPENADLVRSAERLRKAALDQLAETLHAYFAKNDLRRAEATLDVAKKRWGMDPLWQTLHGELERRQAQEAVLCEAELARKQAEHSIWEGRQQAVSRAGKGDLKGALEILEGLCRQYPEHAGLAQDRQAALRKIEVDFVNQTLARITALQGQQKWDAALEEAEGAVRRYPKNVELAAIAMQERRRKEIALCIQDIDSAIASHDWSTAEKRLQAAQERFAGEKALERLVQAVRNGRRQAELKDLSSLVERHLFEGRLEEASREIADKKSEFSNEPVWQSLNRQLELQKAYARALLDAEQLRREARHERAEELLRQAIARGAPDTRAAQLLQSVTAERVQKEREKAIALARQEADRLVKEGKLQDALGLLDRICREYPDDLELADHRRDLEARAEKQRQEAQRLEAERRQAAERARKVASCRAAVDAAVAEREWERALQAIDLAERELPGEPVFAELRASVARERRRVGLEEMGKALFESFVRRDLDRAARQLAAARLDYSGEPLWQSLDKELSRLREYDRLLAEAGTLIVAARYDTAQKTLREAIAIGPADGRADALLKDIADENNAKRRLALQFRLIVRKYRGIIKWAGIAALLILVVGIVAPFVLRRPPVLITLRAEPAEVQLSYRVGVGEHLPGQIIDFKSAGVKFELSPTDDWLTVMPQKGDRLGRLEVRVTKDLKVGIYTDKLIVHANGVTNAPFTIPIRLTVDAVEAPPPVQLKLEREELTFEYTQNGAIPGPEVIRAKQGDIGDATTKTEWMRAEHRTGSVSVRLLPENLLSLAQGRQDGIVKVESADTRVHSIDVRVHLMVEAPRPARKQVPPPAKR